jgi:exo-beta-1,3-glucanase (GH17 family)
LAGYTDVFGPFIWAADNTNNPTGFEFYVDDIQWVKSDVIPAIPLPMVVDDHYFGRSGFGPTGAPLHVEDDQCPARAGDEDGVCHRFTWNGMGGAFTGTFWTDGEAFTNLNGLLVEGGATEVSFYAWSAAGGEKIEFGAGLGDAQWDGAEDRAIFTLTTTPTMYSVPLTNLAGYTDVFGPFIWGADNTDNPNGFEFYVDDIKWIQGGGELRPLPDIYTTGNAINYSAFRALGPEFGEIPSDAEVLEDLGLLQTAGYDLLRLFGADAVSEKILQLAAANFSDMRFQQGLFLEGLAPGPPADNCDSANNDSQVDTAIRLANTYSSVVTVSVGNETSFFAAFMPLNCLEGYITRTRNNVTQPVTADDDYTFYAGTFARKPDTVLPLIDFVSIHTYPFLNYQFWDWRQLGVPTGPLRAEAMMNAALAKAQENYQAVYDYRYRNASGITVTVGESLPIVVGETGWKWRQTTPTQEIEIYAALPVNAKWYNDLMLTWERSVGGPVTIFPFEAFDEAWKTTDDGWGFWDELRMPNYALCGTPAGSACNDPLYEGAGYYSP